MIAERLKTLREMKKLTQAELAKKLNITRSSVNAWEMGISTPSTQYVVELAKLFKVSTDFILGVNSYNSINIDSLSDEEKTIVLGLIQHFNKTKN